MLMTLTDLITEYLDTTKDDTAANRSRGIRRVNQCQSRIMGSDQYPFNEETFSLTTVAQQLAYKIPQRIRKVSSVKFENAISDHVPIEIVSPTKWDELQLDGSVQFSDYPEYYHIRNNNEIQFYPIPSSGNLTINILAQQRGQKLETEDYIAGNISITSGSETVTGTGTAFNTSNNIREGDSLLIKQKGFEYQYRILEIVSDTEITLEDKIDLATESGLEYRIGAVSLLPVDYHDLLWMGPTSDYFKMKENDVFAQFKQEYEQLRAELFSSTRSKTTSNIIQPRLKNPRRNINYYPQNIG